MARGDLPPLRKEQATLLPDTPDGLPVHARMTEWLPHRERGALFRGGERRAGRITPPVAQERGGVLAGPGERSARVAERFADE